MDNKLNYYNIIFNDVDTSDYDLEETLFKTFYDAKELLYYVVVDTLYVLITTKEPMTELKKRIGTDVDYTITPETKEEYNTLKNNYSYNNSYYFKIEFEGIVNTALPDTLFKDLHLTNAKFDYTEHYLDVIIQCTVPEMLQIKHTINKYDTQHKYSILGYWLNMVNYNSKAYDNYIIYKHTVPNHILNNSTIDILDVLEGKAVFDKA